jgi:hypothetical protein
MSSTGVENLVQPSGSPDSFKLPAVHRIRSDQEAIQTAQQIARELEAEASVRDRERRLPQAEIELLTRSGLWGITIPKAFGGPGVSHSTLVEVFATLAAADPSLGQIPHNHFCVIDAIRLDGTEEQKRVYFEQVLAGKRFGNAFSEAGTKNVMDFQTRITPDGDAFKRKGSRQPEVRSDHPGNGRGRRRGRGGLRPQVIAYGFQTREAKATRRASRDGSPTSKR